MKARVSVIGIIGLLSEPALAATTPPTGGLVQIILGLLVVLMVIIGGAWLLKRYGSVPGYSHGPVRVLGGVSLGPRERAMLLQVGERQLLVGVAPGRVQTLHVLEQPVATAPAEHGVNFSERLASLLRTGRTP